MNGATINAKVYAGYAKAALIIGTTYLHYRPSGTSDPVSAAIGDYIIGLEGTLFVAALQPLLPIFMVSCNRTINFLRPASADGVGALGYNGADDDASEQVLMSGWPASVQQGTKGEKGDAILPGDARSPWWSVLVPGVAGITLRSSDIITDDLNRRYTISSAELTDLGWRLTAMQAVT